MRVLRFSIWLGAVGVLLRLGQPAQADASGRGANPALVQEIDAALDAPGLKTGVHGLIVQSLRDQTVLYERNADQVFLPASNNKLLTAGAALALLGADFAYRTALFGTSRVSRDGVLHGDLILRGSGDPLLSPADLKKMAQQARRAGVRRITGNVRYHDALFDRQWLGESWSWDDEPYYYSAQVSALNLNENLADVQVAPGKRIGDPVRVAVGPIANYMTVVNRGRTSAANAKPTLEILRERGRNVVTITGTLPLGSKPPNPTGVTVENPARFAATVLKAYLQQAGVRVDRAEVGEAMQVPSGAQKLAEYVSPTLPTLLKRLNKPSDNLVAECLLKTVGTLPPHDAKPATTERGAKRALEWFLRIGMDTERVRMADGSGLSRTNYVSPRNLVRLLAFYHTEETGVIFRESLPIAGVDGTLRNRFKGTAAAQNVLAKTGTLSYVSALSGYVTTKDGEPLVFSILMNNYLAPGVVARAAQDKIVTLLAEFSRKEVQP